RIFRMLPPRRSKRSVPPARTQEGPWSALPSLDLRAWSGRLPGTMQVLAGDIGGTKTLLAVCEVGPSSERSGAPRIEVLASKRYDSRKYPGLGAICRAFA